MRKVLKAGVLVVATVALSSCGWLLGSVDPTQFGSALAVAAHEMFYWTNTSQLSVSASDSRAFSNTLTINGPDSGSMEFSYDFQSEIVGAVTFSDFAFLTTDGDTVS